MSPEPADHFARLDELFARAIELDTSARAQFLERECGGHVELHAQLRSLLQAHEVGRAFLEESNFFQRVPIEIDPSWLRPGKNIVALFDGPYPNWRETKGEAGHPAIVDRVIDNLNIGIDLDSDENDSWWYGLDQDKDSNDQKVDFLTCCDALREVTDQVTPPFDLDHPDED